MYCSPHNTIWFCCIKDKPNFHAEVCRKYRLFHEVRFYKSQSAFGAAVCVFTISVEG